MIQTDKLLRSLVQPLEVHVLTYMSLHKNTGSIYTQLLFNFVC